MLDEVRLIDEFSETLTTLQAQLLAAELIVHTRLVNEAAQAVQAEGPPAGIKIVEP